MKSTLALILGILLLTHSVQAVGPAGIVLYYRDGRDVYLLLADDTKGVRGWSAFGGKAEEGETEAKTAARETEEETRGYFRREWLEKKIEGQKPVTSNGFSMFFVEVPFVPAQRVTNNPLPDGSGKSMRERTNYAWIPFSELNPALLDKELAINPLYLPGDHTSAVFWDVWIQNMRDAQKQGAWPWQEPAR